MSKVLFFMFLATPIILNQVFDYNDAIDDVQFKDMNLTEISDKFCQIKCPVLLNNRKHIGCKCHERYPQHTEALTTPIEVRNFRDEMTGAINNVREFIAAGGLTKTNNLSSASNMMLVNYDLELEYISRCFARHYHLLTTVGDTKCMRGLDGAELEVLELKDMIAWETYDWFYMKLRSLTNEAVSAFDPVRDKSARDVALWLWSSIDRVGCGVIENPDADSKRLNFCLLKGYKNGAILKKGQPVYKAGTPCSSCPEDLSCNKDLYPSLCGTTKPIPTEIAELLPFSRNESTSTEIGSYDPTTPLSGIKNKQHCVTLLAFYIIIIIAQ